MKVNTKQTLRVCGHCGSAPAMRYPRMGHTYCESHNLACACREAGHEPKSGVVKAIAKYLHTDMRTIEDQWTKGQRTIATGT